MATNTTTEELTDEQRLEVRRSLLQSIAEIQRGLTLAGLQLKKGMFSGARDTITGTEAMLILHEGMAQLLLQENSRLQKSAEEIWDEAAEAVTEHWVASQYRPNGNGPADPPANPYAA